MGKKTNLRIYIWKLQFENTFCPSVTFSKKYAIYIYFFLYFVYSTKNIMYVYLTENIAILVIHMVAITNLFM